MAKAIKKELDQNGNIVDVEVSNELTVKKESTIKKYEPKEYVFRLIDKFYSTSTHKPPFPETYTIRNTDVIYDEESEMERNIRYLEGVSTIFEDEQEHLSDQKKRQRPEIRFIYGTLVVPAHKTSLVKFLTVSNMNNKTVKRMPNTRPVYELINFEEQEQAAIDKSEYRMDAMKIAMNAPREIMIPHCDYIGVPFKNQYGIERSERGIRVDYLEFADKNPDAFIKTYNNPIVKVQYIINKAINVNMIDLSFTKGQAVWGDTKKFIAQIPDNALPVKFLSELCLTDKGKDFYAQLKSIVE
jgi:hypothetical protein